MSESKQPCPVCNRPVGGFHHDTCPRSAHVTRSLGYVTRNARTRGVAAGFGDWARRLLSRPRVTASHSLGHWLQDLEPGTIINHDGRRVRVVFEKDGTHGVEEVR